MRQRSASGAVHLFGLFFIIVLIAGAISALRTIQRVSDVQIRLSNAEHQLELLDLRVKNLEGK